MNVLALDASGLPRAWVNLEDAICYHAKDQVVWSLGETIAEFRGGYRNDGSQSVLQTTSIIAVRGSVSLEKIGKVVLTNRTLFGRDRHMCAYCGDVHGNASLSRDHIHPVSKGGANVWMNVVTCCLKCNAKKGNKSLEQAGMELLYIPYEPNHYERMILENRNILADQMDYLLSGVPKHSRVRLM
jgi:5-methylcytosine-specific restriction endonuclease McrA